MTEMPAGWTAAPLKELIADDGIFTDGDWVESKDQDPCGSVRLIQLADIADSHFVDKSSRFLTREKATELNCTFLKKGDLLVARMPDPLGRCCTFPLDGEERFVTVVDVCAIRLGGASIEPRYLMRAINAPEIRAKISALQSGSTRKRISRGNLATIPIPIPPLNEQCRIVEKIEAMFERIDKGVENLRAAKTTLALYRQSLLKSAFEGRLTTDWRAQNADKLEDPKTLLARIQRERDTRYKSALDDWQTALSEWRDGGEKGKKPAKPKRSDDVAPLEERELKELFAIPNAWAFSRVGLYIDWIEAGKSFKCLETEPRADQVGVAKVSAVSWGEYDESESKTCLDEDKINEAWFIREGDFLLSRANTIELVGASVITKKGNSQAPSPIRGAGVCAVRAVR
jgi:type I restriction enzyme S subunit